MNFRQLVPVVFASVLLTACGTPPQVPVPMSSMAFAPPSNSYGVVVQPVPKADTSFPGADCLLCMAAVSVANSGLTSYTQTLPVDDLQSLNVQIGEALKKKGAKVTMIDSIDFKALPDNKNRAANFARKDFSGLKSKYNIDKLVVVEISATGYMRTYASYFPTSDPKARVAGLGYIVNLNDNSLEWYKPVLVVKASDGKWDEPPKFPGLTNAYFQAVELARDEILVPLAQ